MLTVEIIPNIAKYVLSKIATEFLLIRLSMFRVLKWDILLSLCEHHYSRVDKSWC